MLLLLFLQCRDFSLLFFNLLLSFIFGLLVFLVLSFDVLQHCFQLRLFFQTFLFGEYFLLLGDPVVSHLIERFKLSLFVIIHEEAPHQAIIRVLVKLETPYITHVFVEHLRQALTHHVDWCVLLELADLPQAVAVWVIDKIAPRQLALPGEVNYDVTNALEVVATALLHVIGGAGARES